MKTKVMVFSWILLIAFFSGCARSPERSYARTEQRQEAQAPHLLGSLSTTIVFEKGRSTLSKESEEHLKKLTARAHQSRKTINQVRVLAWSDHEYPDNMKTKATTMDVKLATARAEKIKDYLEEELKETEEIHAYNMARKPNLISTLFQTDEYEVKRAFESSGTTGTRLPDGSISYTKASKALVIIDYK